MPEKITDEDNLRYRKVCINYIRMKADLVAQVELIKVYDELFKFKYKLCDGDKIDKDGVIIRKVL
jgi:hypothetical protein